MSGSVHNRRKIQYGRAETGIFALPLANSIQAKRRQTAVTASKKMDYDGVT